MVKSGKKVNLLIKQKNLALELKKAGIKRINKESVKLLNEYLIGNLIRLAPLLNEEIVVHGRKTLMKEDIIEVLNKIKKEEKGWEA